MWPVTHDVEFEIRSQGDMIRDGATGNCEPKTEQLISDCRSFPGPRWGRQDCR
jgi:hypothetical protein